MWDDLGGGFPRHFGVDDKPRCPNCSELTFLSRRSPAGQHEYERQRFTCPACGLELERVVDANGFGVALEDS